jgi:hypothetical protein
VGSSQISTLVARMAKRDKMARASGKSVALDHRKLWPMDSTSTDSIRQLNEEEISRLERALGKPIERNYLVYWIATAIRDLVKLSIPIVSPREYRDELKEIVRQGRRWIETVKQSRSVPLLPNVLEVEHVISSVATFSDAVASITESSDNSVGPGRPQTHLALEAFLGRLIGIAKRAKVRPSTPSRATVDPTDPRPGPPFYDFVIEALEIAADVIKSSGLSQTKIDAALAISTPSDQVLIKTIERVRGKIGDFREGSVGLVEWDLAKSSRRRRPKNPRNSSK